MARKKQEPESIEPILDKLQDWRGDVLRAIRALIWEADPDVVETVKWKKPSNPDGVPVWEHAGILCTGETYRDKVKLTFPNGSKLEDPHAVFNASLEGTRRALDIFEGDPVNEAAFKDLIRSAIAYNLSWKERPKEGEAPKILAGGNPQIPKGYGEEPIQAYIAAIPDWKRPIVAQIDRLVTEAFPRITKAVRWNSPMYKLDQGWILSLHCFTKYVKVAFFDGEQLDPLPPEVSKMKKVRYLHVSESEPLDEAQFVEWVHQASRLPGEQM